MKHRIGLVLMFGLLFGGGCTTYQAYPGDRRPRAEVSLLIVPWADLVVDSTAIARASNVGRIELLPGSHVIEWEYVYPNHHRKARKLEFETEAGQTYRLGQRFFPDPHPSGPIGAVVDGVVQTVLAPFWLIVTPPEPTAAPQGDYFMWIVHQESQHVVAGLAPDVPAVHEPITYVPAGEN